MPLRQTFVHLPGISLKKESSLWKAGVTTWDDLQNHEAITRGKKRSKIIMRDIERSLLASKNNDLRYFFERLPKSELWRLLPGNEKITAFLDIETTGLDHPPVGKVTTISVLLNGKLYQSFDRRSHRQLLEMLEFESQIIATFFGDVFDLPYLRKAFRIPLKKAQVDLCFWLRRNGFSGGLKNVERSFPGRPKRRLEGLDGSVAVKLWELFQSGHKNALETLLIYNGEDTVILQHLAEAALALEQKRFGGQSFKVKMPRLPRVPGKVCPKILKLIRAD